MRLNAAHCWSQRILLAYHRGRSRPEWQYIQKNLNLLSSIVLSTLSIYTWDLERSHILTISIVYRSMYQLLVRARQLDLLQYYLRSEEYRANYLYSSHERNRVEFVLHCTHNKLVSIGLQSTTTKRTNNGESSNRQWWKQQAYERRLTVTRIQQNRWTLIHQLKSCLRIQ